MSYCRFSSDFGDCDVYTYAHYLGWWETHVANRRLKHRVPDEIRNMPTENGEQWIAQWKAQKQWERDNVPSDVMTVNFYNSKTGKSEPGPMYYPKDSEYIDLKTVSEHAGKHFQDQSPGDCAKTLEMLRDSGLNVPQHAIDALYEEQSTKMEGCTHADHFCRICYDKIIEEDAKDELQAR